MTEAELKAKLDVFRALPAETECVEFKKASSSYDFDKLGCYFSALANEANLSGHPAACHSTRADIDSLLLDKLSDTLSPSLKKNKIGNLLGALARADGVIRNQGSDRKPEWVLVENENKV